MEERYSLKDIMKITGLTKRTLHYYDEVGLLKPSKNQNNSYRYYSQENLIKLQKIIMLKSLDLNLKEIKDLIEKDNVELRLLLAPHLKKLHEKIVRLNNIENNLKNFINGESIINLNIFKKPLEIQYSDEAEIKYGNTYAYKSFKKKYNDDILSKDKVEREMDKVFNDFNYNSINNVPYQNVRDIVLRWKKILTTIADFNDDILCNIALGYEADPRFKDFFEKYKNDNLTKYISEAVLYTLKNNSEH